MSYTYAQQKKHGSQKHGAEPHAGGETEFSLPNSAMVENLGHQVDMPVVMREKMEGAFGMDLSAVKLYENKAVGEAGAEAVTQGSNIAFAPGKLDFSSTHGQALLGHEISHAASQAKGEVKGSGLVNDSALEARADREGLMAARGESVADGYGGASAPLSSASAVSAAGPMQAKSGKKEAEEPKSKLQPELITEAEIEKTENGEKKSRVPYTAPSLGTRLKNYFKNVLFQPHPIAFFEEPLSVRERMSYENKHMWDTYDADEDAKIDNYKETDNVFKKNAGLEHVYNLGRHDPDTGNSLIYPENHKRYVNPYKQIGDIDDIDTQLEVIEDPDENEEENGENLIQIPSHNKKLGDFKKFEEEVENLI
ncbi:MAG: DUF4157 domain-containing protein [Anaerolineaceae bacterium]|nr:DUF4157 domain-containing protein [Anaerolineaceae bacterium]